jgi:hypothetical protein
MTNPLIEKFYELHPEKKKPKVIKADEVEGEVTLTQVENAFKKWSSNTPVASNFPTTSVATSNTGIAKASTLVSHDKHSGNDAFLQIAEKVKNGTAQVTSVSLQIDVNGIFSYGKRITFEVYDYEP